MRLSAINAVITGASQGLGREIARQFLKEGAAVALCARDGARLELVRLELAAEFPLSRIFTCPCDVSKEAEVTLFIDAVRTQFGGIHALVLNAGIYGPMGPTEEVPLEDWWRAMEVNVGGVLLFCREVMPEFKARKSGKIIILSGGGATNPLPNISAYAASKAAVVRLAETLALELQPFGVDVNCIAPGAMRTRMVEEVLAAGPEKVGAVFFEKNQQWASQGATPLEVPAALAVCLASAESNGITGRLISAAWDPWRRLHQHVEELRSSDIYTLRRIVPGDRGKFWDQPE